MKTLIQELIEQIKSSRDDQKKGSKEYNAYAVCVEFAEAMLEKEKEVMCHFADNYVDQVMGGMTKRAEQHFNQTFNTEEK